MILTLSINIYLYSAISVLFNWKISSKAYGDYMFVKKIDILSIMFYSVIALIYE